MCWKSYYSASFLAHVRGRDLGAFGFRHAPYRGFYSGLDHDPVSAIRALYFVPDPLNVSFVAVHVPFNF